MNIFKKAYELEQDNKTFALATLIETDGSTPRNDTAKMIILSNGESFGTIGGGGLEQAVIKEALISIKNNKTKVLRYNLDGSGRDQLNMICGGKAKVFIDVINAEPIIVLLGGGHVNYAISKYIDILNYKYIVIDNIEAMANSDRFPNAYEIINKEFTDGLKDLDINDKYNIVIATRGHEFDGICLESIIKSNASYIGMIGSKIKIKTIYHDLIKKGYKEELSKVYAPIGLDIGTETPEEIALSIISEILKVRSNGTGKSLKDIMEIGNEI